MPARRRARRTPLVTLTSDVGAAYAAQMKGVLLRRLSPGRVVDLAHDLEPHDVREAAFVLRAMAVTFPPGTVHVAVVDPGVGGRRAPIVIDCRDGSRLVGPDNGVLYPLAEALGVRATYRITADRRGTRTRVGTTFDGRDVFAPAAARLARGTAPRSLGPRVTPQPLSIPRPQARSDGASGEVVHVDRFGNLISNVPAVWMPSGRPSLRVRVGRRTVRAARSASYEAVSPGALGVLGSSFGSLEVFRSGERADRYLGAGVGSRLRFFWGRPRSRVRA